MDRESQASESPSFWELVWSALKRQATAPEVSQRLQRIQKRELRALVSQQERRLGELEYARDLANSEELRAAIMQAQARQQEQLLEAWLSDIGDVEKRQALKLQLMETKRTYQ